MIDKRPIATNWRDVDQLKEELWLQSFLEMISIEGDAANLS